MLELMDSWVAQAKEGGFSFLEGRTFDLKLLRETMDLPSRLLADDVALDNFCRAQVCLAMGDPVDDHRFVKLSCQSIPVPYPTVYQLLSLLHEQGLLGDTGCSMLDDILDFVPSFYLQEGGSLLSLYQLQEFAKVMGKGCRPEEYRDFFFRPMMDGCTNRLARYVIDIDNDPLVEQALRDCSMDAFFGEKETAIHAVMFLLRTEHDRLVVFKTVRYLWQQICLPSNTFLSKYKHAIGSLPMEVPYGDLSFNAGFLKNRPVGLPTKLNADRFVAWCPALRTKGFKEIINCWGRLLISPSQSSQAHQLKALVDAFLATEGQPGWGIALLWLLGMIHE